MNERECRRLEAWLARELKPEQSRSFLAHLDECTDCRREVDEASALDDLLRKACAEFEVPPREWLEMTRAALANREPAPADDPHRPGGAWKRGMAWVAAASAAAAILIGAALLSPPDDEPPVAGAPGEHGPAIASVPVPDVGHSPPAPADREGAPGIEAKIVVAPNVLAAPLASEDKDVSIFWLYPAVSVSAADAHPGSNQPTGKSPEKG
jgi:anti-sigma factor RsiW